MFPCSKGGKPPSCLLSVFERTLAGKEHGDVFFVAGFNHFKITQRASGLRNGAYALGGSRIDSVTEREKSVRNHAGADESAFFFRRFPPLPRRVLLWLFCPSGLRAAIRKEIFGDGGK